MTTETFAIPLAAAEAYERTFVPAIFAEWAPHTVAAGRVGPGDRVLDVGCGTGIVARTAADVVGATGSVIGIDRNPAMLTVAARVRPDLDWREDDVADLSFADDAFDVVTCQMAAMFFPDRSRAYGEMARVTRPGGFVAVVVPAALDQQPGYGPFVDIVARHAGAEARPLLSTYWSCGEVEELVASLTEAGLELVEARTRVGTARFATPQALVDTEIDASPLGDRLGRATRTAIRADVAAELGRYRSPGRFDIPLACQVVTTRVPS